MNIYMNLVNLERERAALRHAAVMVFGGFRRVMMMMIVKEAVSKGREEGAKQSLNEFSHFEREYKEERIMKVRE